MAQARTEPPSEQRVAEAKHAGHVPRTTMVGPLLSFAAASATLSWLSERFVRGLRALYVLPLDAQRLGQPLDPARFLEGVMTEFVPLTVLVLVVVLLTVCAGLWLVQGFVFRVGRAKPRVPFGKLESTRVTAFLLTSLAVSTVVSMSYVDALSASPGDFVEIIERVALRLSILGVLIAIVEAAFARATFFRSLWLTRQQKRDEEREAYGSPEIRIARERARREAGMLAQRRVP